MQWGGGVGAVVTPEVPDFRELEAPRPTKRFLPYIGLVASTTSNFGDRGAVPDRRANSDRRSLRLHALDMRIDGLYCIGTHGNYGEMPHH